MEIILRARSRRIKHKVERDHYWYDPHTRNMLHGRGGEMRFLYERGRQIPYIVEKENWIWQNDYHKIVDWVKENSDKVRVLDSANGHFILIDIDDNDLDNLTYSLNGLGIMFDT